MDQNLQAVIELVNANVRLSEEEKAVVLARLKEVDKKITITEFKLDRTEKVKKTTAILLEETIQELEQKRKAVEQQNRELEIEASLERVRAVAMGMMKPGDLMDICRSLYNECHLLEFAEVRNAIIHTYNEGDYFIDYDYSDFTRGHISRIPYSGNPILDKFVHDIRKTRDAFTEMIITGNDLKEWKLFRDANNETPDERLNTASALYYYIYSIGAASIGISTFSPVSADKLEVLKRFRNVFDLAYKRYVDITNAEAQAREAKIEAALEKVRSRTMAMYHSNELSETASVTFRQIKDLGFEIWSCGFCIWKDNDIVEAWMGAGAGGTLSPLLIPYKDERTHRDIYEASLKNKAAHEAVWDGKLLEEHFAFLETIPSAKLALNQLRQAGLSLPVSEYYYVGFFKHGYLLLITTEPDKKALDISKRFAAVFDLTYTRFLDLQKAEAQAREAQLEAALERVRSIAMGMMRSDDLLNICEAVFVQLALLGFNDMRAAQIYIRNDEEEEFINYDYADVTGADVVHVKYNSHPNTKRIYEVIKTAGDALVDNVIHKQELQEWKDYLYNTLGQPPEEKLDSATELHYYLYSFGNGAFGISNFASLTNEDLEILKRFRNVFSFSYQRYTDISHAEEQAREAKIEAALERVRSRTLAMQKSSELAETAAVLFKQLIGLGIAPNRLYIGIVHDETGNIEFWITDEDGSKVSTMFTGNAYNNSSIKKMYDGWKLQNKAVVIDMQGQELADYFHYLGEELRVPFKEGLLQKRRLQHIAYFSKGFIGIASPDEQPQETVELLARFASVFNLTFTRFNDLKIAEAHALQAEQDLIEIKEARKKAEDALSELQVTQRQLIQSEKMASLGELTAGIAHEIQNPLNFVNNFSEVSSELIDELLIEKAKDKRDEQLENELLTDIRQNLEKINHHGKRADAIVKGMLQHSRAGSAQKELTDINVLCDEYVRLCYHGLRAKDKTFNAIIKTDFDTSIQKINILPQDVGRVILNILTNAFYAVNEKKKSVPEGYQPAVSVSTRGDVNTVEIKVMDNGKGIPQNIVDKIFQPFFTTKPTGQGTGLGLSLSYDIIKAHGGEIKVETAVGEGTVFIVTLPL